MSEWLCDVSVPLRTLDPDDPDTSDLEPLREVVGDARVVCVGESAHGVAEFGRLRDRVWRFLVRELGFSAFVLESGFPEGLGVDAWISGGPGRAPEVARTGITYGFGEAAEMHAQLDWMRRWNASSTPRVRFYGMDLPGSSTSPGPGVRACLERLQPRHGDAALAALGDLGAQFEALDRYAAMSAAERGALSAGMAELYERATREGDEIAVRCARSLQCLDEILVNGWSGGRNVRDEFMAETVKWILGHGGRIVVAAHNGHIQRAAYNGMTMLGQLLDAELGAETVVIGTTYASGSVTRIRQRSAAPGDWDVSLDPLFPPPHTLDAVLDQAGWPLHLLDVRRAPRERFAETTAMMVNHDPTPLDPLTAFDAVIHVRHVTPVPGAFERLRAALDSRAPGRVT